MRPQAARSISTQKNMSRACGEFTLFAPAAMKRFPVHRVRELE